MNEVLEPGAIGPAVTRLQEALLSKGFNPGVVDGRFGLGTLAALLAFQRSEVMLADGVAGPRTLAALGLVASPDLPDAATGMTAQIVSKMCPDTPIANIKRSLPIVLQSLARFRLSHRTMVLMAIATIRAETESFLPISEGRSKFNTSPNGHPFDLYDHRKDLGNDATFDGEKYKGRGFVQLTGRHNYIRYGKKLSPTINLAATPDLANSAPVAADLLSLFLADRELQIKDALLHGNMQAARRLVNGGVHGLDRFTEAYRIGDALLD
ncbi:peptidoglycan-binding protein [Massilia sp. CF038]|uniref:peptidoglycan-binding protein n=1 Tax=Massilia sp. CF038 TaxID=1881045 RepID=UPI0009220F05|nr:peptidoglycan-binding protein [Massilia sp. CF038]SHH62934.1 peptidoglycan L-alanyl-D-glutamate endopeptidase CwlK [Massilia sp. CF038]